MEKRIITIGRECGSGGHTIGKLVAERLGIAFYDKEIVELVAAKTKLSPEFIAAHGEYFQGGSLGHIIGYGGRFAGASMRSQSSLQDQMFIVQSDLIREIAEKEPCVIVGRCADYVLRDRPATLKVYLHASEHYRTKRIMKTENLSKEDALQKIRRMDHRRSDNYRYYTGRLWGRAQNYDLTVNTEIGTAAVQNIIKELLEIKLIEAGSPA